LRKATENWFDEHPDWVTEQQTGRTEDKNIDSYEQKMTTATAYTTAVG
jgi:hypothetical protein